jgi:hypothetical protein
MNLSKTIPYRHPIVVLLKLYVQMILLQYRNGHTKCTYVHYIITLDINRHFSSIILVKFKRVC